MSQPLIRLRRAEPSDCRLLWDWANDPAVRASAFSSEPIRWEAHERWFAGKLRDVGCIQFIAFNELNKPVGQIRFELSVREDGLREAVTDVSVAPGKRGLGFGSGIVRAGVAELMRVTSVDAVHAWIKAGNLASCQAFAAAGFQERGTETIQGQKSVHYHYDPDDRS